MIWFSIIFSGQVKKKFLTFTCGCVCVQFVSTSLWRSSELDWMVFGILWSVASFHNIPGLIHAYFFHCSLSSHCFLLIAFIGVLSERECENEKQKQH